MIQGTGSHVGKSVIVAALCRIFSNEGIRVVPFKSQNMALNSFITKDGGEIGRAQAVQAQAARIEPSIHMNPILLKPSADSVAQVIMRGKPYANMSAIEYQNKRLSMTGVIAESLNEINKFRGDLNILKPGLDFLEDKTGIPVAGVVPYFRDIWIEEEDTIPFEGNKNKNSSKVNIAAIRLPHISNFTDFDVFLNDNQINFFYAANINELESADAIIVPGSKSTISDLNYLKKNGIVDKIIEKNKKGVPVIGICGGYQMLGKNIYDPLNAESKESSVDGIGLLDVKTIFSSDKTTCQVEAYLNKKETFFGDLKQAVLKGYEIHMGNTERLNGFSHLFKITKRNWNETAIEDGAISQDGSVAGTYIHGIFDNDLLRNNFINSLLKLKGINEDFKNKSLCKEEQFDKLAEIVEENIDMNLIRKVISYKSQVTGHKL
ncbi:MAG: cobyric acid synthase [Actinobacteria bacterium]|nr:cobyric acid synthase [Actinomycetota bacterium]